MNVIHYVFITAILMFAITFAGYSSAQSLGSPLPKEDNPELLPEYFPCHYVEYSNYLRCRWAVTTTKVDIYNDRTGRYESHFTERYGKCLEDGECYVRGEYIGNSGRAGDIRISIHYYVVPAEDGKAVAYRYGTGPGFDGEAVTWDQALHDYHRYMRRFGLNDYQLLSEMNHGTGIPKQVLAEVITGEKPAQPKPAAQPAMVVTEAWCNTRSDDECYVNNVRVPMARLGDYLPLITDEAAEAQGGHCEYPLCYDGDYNPIGYRQGF